MLCEKCKNKKPTVFFTDTGGVNHALCAACASSYSQVSSEATASPEVLFRPHSCLSLGSVLTHTVFTKADGVQICPSCKTPYPEIQSSGLFGCPDCATAILDSPHHFEMPLRLRKQQSREEELCMLRETLSELISREDFESAAKVRDKIRKLQSQK